MLVSRLKRCVSHTQMRHFATFPLHTRIEVRKGAINQCTELKYSYSLNPSRGMHKLFNTNVESDGSRSPMTSLMYTFPRQFPFFPILQFYIIYKYLRFTVDKDFRLNEFLFGVKQAICVISYALVARDYQALDGIVRDRTIKLLKGRVNRLSNTQRQMININPKNFYYAPTNSSLRTSKDKTVTIFEADIFGLYYEDSFEYNNIKFCSYRFQRKYKNGIGEPWVVTLLNHTLHDHSR